MIQNGQDAAISPDLLLSHSVPVALLEFTTRCNLRCVYCARSRNGYTGGCDLDPSSIEQITSQLIEQGVKSITVNGHGETTLYRDWHVLCRAMLERSVMLNIITNLSKRFSADEIETLAQFNTIEVSIDTVDAGLFSRLRRGAEMKTLFRNMADILKAAVAAGRIPPRFCWSCVVCDANVLQLRRYVETALEFGVRNFNFCNLVKYPDVEGALAVRHVSEREPAFMAQALREMMWTFMTIKKVGASYFCSDGLIDSIKQRLFSKAGDEAAAPQAPAGRKTYSTGQPEGMTRNCTDPWKQLFIHANRDVSPCCVIGAVGTLGPDAGLGPIVNGEAMMKLRHDLLTGTLDKNCATCPTRGWVRREEFHRNMEQLLKVESPVGTCL
jgi:MoaA/NifB/PqqE/SkfB family radical SAM enzyme